MEGEWGVSREKEVASCPIVQCYSEILFWVFLNELESPVCPHHSANEEHLLCGGFSAAWPWEMRTFLAYV